MTGRLPGERVARRHPGLGCYGYLGACWAHIGGLGGVKSYVIGATSERTRFLSLGAGKPTDYAMNTNGTPQGQSATMSGCELPGFYNQSPAWSTIDTTTEAEERFLKAKRRPPESYPNPEGAVFEGGGSEGTGPRRSTRTFTNGQAGGEPQREPALRLGD